jgi:hypothetical protein
MANRASTARGVRYDFMEEGRARIAVKSARADELDPSESRMLSLDR